MISSDIILFKLYNQTRASLVAQMVKNLPAMQETWVRSLGWEDPPEKGTATHSSILAWRIPWTGEPGRLQSMGSQRVRRDGVTFTFIIRVQSGNQEHNFNLLLRKILSIYKSRDNNTMKPSCTCHPPSTIISWSIFFLFST